MTFRDQSFSRRLGALGDLAEGVFEATYHEGYVRFGLNRPPINLARVPAFVRYTPDYLTAKGLVEVQGFGRDQTFKLKVDKYEALRQWDATEDWPLYFFTYDSHAEQWAWVELHELAGVLHSDDVRLFPEGKPYYAVPRLALPTSDGWHDVDAA